MIDIRNLSKTFTVSGNQVDALKNVSLQIHDGDIYGIIGASGAGKSTLVRCINLLEKPSSGEILIDGKDVTRLPVRELRKARRSIAMIFQSFNLLMQRNCLANVCFPLELAGVGKTEAKKRAEELLELVGLPDKAKAYPAHLSGGQQQRVAIARALATNPKVLLCDEATSALDPKTTQSILELIRDINQRLGITVIVITHQMQVVEEICNRVAILENGAVAEEGEVSEIFSHPKTQAVRHLVFPEESQDALPVQNASRLIRVVFHGADATSRPLITQMAMDTGIAANILYASARCIGGKVYGKMLLSLPDEHDTVDRAVRYLAIGQDVTVEEVEADV